MIGILLAWYLGLQYRHRPESYFRDTYHYWTTANSQVMADCSRAFDPLNDHLPHGWWPLVLFNLGKQYVRGEHQGQEGTGQYEAALLRHVAAQGDTPGPVKDSLTTMRQLHKTALENEVGTWDRLQDSNLKRILAPILKSRTRLAAMLEVEDFVNEAVVAASEIANEPWSALGVRKEVVS